MQKRTAKDKNIQKKYTGAFIYLSVVDLEQAVLWQYLCVDCQALSRDACPKPDLPSFRDVPCACNPAESLLALVKSS